MHLDNIIPHFGGACRISGGIKRGLKGGIKRQSNHTSAAGAQSVAKGTVASTARTTSMLVGVSSKLLLDVNCTLSAALCGCPMLHRPEA